MFSEPSAPVNVEFTDIELTSLVVKWAVPERPNGVIMAFKVRVVMATGCAVELFTAPIFRFITIQRTFQCSMMSMYCCEVSL